MHLRRGNGFPLYVDAIGRPFTDAEAPAQHKDKAGALSPVNSSLFARCRCCLPRILQARIADYGRSPSYQPLLVLHSAPTCHCSHHRLLLQ